MTDSPSYCASVFDAETKWVGSVQ